MEGNAVRRAIERVGLLVTSACSSFVNRHDARLRSPPTTGQPGNGMVFPVVDGAGTTMMRMNLRDRFSVVSRLAFPIQTPQLLDSS
jgi:hypothetical protein